VDRRHLSPETAGMQGAKFEEGLHVLPEFSMLSTKKPCPVRSMARNQTFGGRNDLLSRGTVQARKGADLP